MTDPRAPGPATGLALLIPITLSTKAIVLLAPVLPRMFDAFKSVTNHAYLVPMVLTHARIDQRAQRHATRGGGLT